MFASRSLQRNSWTQKVPNPVFARFGCRGYRARTIEMLYMERLKYRGTWHLFLYLAIPSKLQYVSKGLGFINRVSRLLVLRTTRVPPRSWMRRVPRRCILELVRLSLVAPVYSQVSSKIFDLISVSWTQRGVMGAALCFLAVALRRLRLYFVMAKRQQSWGEVGERNATLLSSVWVLVIASVVRSSYLPDGA
jgi:hypothetical protein